MAVRTADNYVTRTSARTWTMSDWGLFIVRFFLGVIFVMHGAQKVFGVTGGHPLADSAAFMGHMGIPIYLAYLSIFTEFVGGIFLIFGFLSRVAAVGLFINMVVAIALVHFKNGFFLSGGPGPGYEYNIALIAMALAIVLGGPGALSIVDLEKRAVEGTTTT